MKKINKNTVIFKSNLEKGTIKRNPENIIYLDCEKRVFRTKEGKIIDTENELTKLLKTHRITVYDKSKSEPVIREFEPLKKKCMELLLNVSLVTERDRRIKELLKHDLTFLKKRITRRNERCIRCQKHFRHGITEFELFDITENKVIGHIHQYCYYGLLGV